MDVQGKIPYQLPESKTIRRSNRAEPEVLQPEKWEDNNQVIPGLKDYGPDLLRIARENMPAMTEIMKEIVKIKQIETITQGQLALLEKQRNLLESETRAFINKMRAITEKENIKAQNIIEMLHILKSFVLQSADSEETKHLFIKTIDNAIGKL